MGKCGITGDYVGVQTDDREFKLVPVKRNKRVDVPTEAWQKRIERDINEIRTTILNEVTRTEKTEETLIILVAYLSSVGLLDMNDWNKYLQISRK